MCGDLAPAGPPVRREVASVPAPGSAAPARLRLSPFAVNVCECRALQENAGEQARAKARRDEAGAGAAAAQLNFEDMA